MQKRGSAERERQREGERLHCTFHRDVTSYSRTRAACNKRFRNFSGNRRTRLPAFCIRRLLLARAEMRREKCDTLLSSAFNPRAYAAPSSSRLLPAMNRRCFAGRTWLNGGGLKNAIPLRCVFYEMEGRGAIELPALEWIRRPAEEVAFCATCFLFESTLVRANGNFLFARRWCNRII